jgi:hypothetical protein
MFTEQTLEHGEIAANKLATYRLMLPTGPGYRRRLALPY